MYHYLEAIIDSATGKTFIGAYARVLNAETGSSAPIYADNNGTPIATVTGLANAAKTDGDGNLSFFIVPGTYHLDLYDTDGETFIRRFSDIPMTSTQGREGDPGPEGPPGPSNNTRVSLAALKGAATTDKTSLYDGSLWTWTEGNFTGQADDQNIVTSDSAPLSQGAWVRQRADGVAYDKAQSVQGKLDRLIYATDARFAGGAKGDGIADDTAAINAALAYAGSLTVEDTPFSGSGYVVKGGATVFLPPGKYRTTATLLLPQNVSLVGAKDRSTVIVSTATGHVIRNIATPTVQGTYDRAGMALRNFDIIGDRSIAGQDGIGMLRPYEMIIDGVHVTGCGGRGLHMRQALCCTISNFRATRNGGAGIEFGAGATDWGEASNDLPSNANVLIAPHSSQNDGPGLYFAPGSNGNTVYGPTLEYNFFSTLGASGSCQILSESDGYVANMIHEPWVEGPCEAQIRINHNGITTPIDIIAPKLFSGEGGNVLRAVIVQSGTARIFSPKAPATAYPSVNGSVAPIRFTDKSKARVELFDPIGALTAPIDWVEYLDGQKAGMQNNFALRSAGYSYGLQRHFYDGGQVAAHEYYRLGEAEPYVQVQAFDGAIGFGPGGNAAPDVRVKRTGPRTLGLDNRGYSGGSFFDHGSAWDDNHLLLGAHHLWVDGTGKLRIKGGAPTSDTDGTIVGAQA